MNNKILDEEKKHLEYTKNVIESEIKKSLESSNKVREDSIKLSFEDRLRGAHFDLNSQLFVIGERVEKLEKSRKKPYFGRMDYKNKCDFKIQKIYIGKSAILDNDNMVVYDWRSPICGLYYDSEIGPVSYNALSGIQNGDLLLKRQLIIKNGELINVFDSNLVTDDELLIPYLNVNANNKMKDIVASIQKEQNYIIRLNDEDIIVQGVAGSGKTSVALHRIAYLVYNNGQKNKSNNFLVIGPNDYFLNYISSVLPDLETPPVAQKTLLNLMNDYINKNISLKEDILFDNEIKQCMQKHISTFKGSLEYRDLLDKFLKKCIEGNTIVSDDFKIDGKTIFSTNEIKDRLFGNKDKCFDFDRTKKYFKLLFKEQKENIYEKLNREYRNIYKSLPKGDPIRDDYIKKSMELLNLIKKQGEKLLDKYFKSINKSCLSLYTSFINELDQMETTLTENEIRMLQIETLKSIKKNQVTLDDIAALLYLNYILTNEKLDYQNIVIDEAQDYSIFTYYVLKKIFEKAKFNMYGDLAQAIYPYRSVNSWDELNKCIFENQCNLLELNKSYRTTIEITETANNVLDLLDLHIADPVIRHGQKISYFESYDNSNIKIEKIKEWLDNGYKTIAIICKNDKEADIVHSELLKMGINSKHITKEDNKYENGVFVLSVASSKGLEFDCVVINDASSNVYNVSNEVDMHLLYVALTRALHEQIIMYDKNITNVLENNVANVKVMKKR